VLSGVFDLLLSASVGPGPPRVWVPAYGAPWSRPTTTVGLAHDVPGPGLPGLWVSAPRARSRPTR